MTGGRSHSDGAGLTRRKGGEVALRRSRPNSEAGREGGGERARASELEKGGGGAGSLVLRHVGFPQPRPLQRLPPPTPPRPRQLIAQARGSRRRRARPSGRAVIGVTATPRPAAGPSFPYGGPPPTVPPISFTHTHRPPFLTRATARLLSCAMQLRRRRRRSSRACVCVRVCVWGGCLYDALLDGVAGPLAVGGAGAGHDYGLDVALQRLHGQHRHLRVCVCVCVCVCP